MYPDASDPRTATWRLLAVATAIGGALLGCAPTSDEPAPPSAEKIPITTSSEEARQAYLTGRHLSESLRATDARPHFERAIELDESFALAHLALANTAPSAQAFFDSLESAALHAPEASPGEQAMIESVEAAVRSDPVAQRSALDRLISLHPEDERAQNLLAAFHFARQEYPAAIRHYVRATEISPEFAPPYNQLGYAQRFQERYAEAEETFKRYIALLPDEPNPLDSYAELLMKMGRFEDSIESYRLALEKDPNFVASYVGIGTNLLLLDRYDEARANFRTLHQQARDVGEKRQAAFGVVASHIFEGDHASALEGAMELFALAQEIDDRGTMSGDLNLMGDILLHAGIPDEAAVRYGEAIKEIELAKVPEEVKEATRRNHHYDLARVALATGDEAAAEREIALFAELAEGVGLPAELRQAHELKGRSALAKGDFATALAELEQANQRDPRVLYLMAIACSELGDDERAMELGYKAANWNALGLNYAYIRGPARQLIEDLDAG
jgi:tetratricopeptide (TPR) repeat protein